MTYIRHLLKAYPVSCFYILMILVLCFATIPSTPLDNVTLIDKWVHIAMYTGTCATIWLEYLRSHSVKRQPVMRIASSTDKPALSWAKLLCLAWLAPILMSGLIEILQEYCTGGRRSGDWLDFAANSIGADTWCSRRYHNGLQQAFKAVRLSQNGSETFAKRMSHFSFYIYKF